MQFVEIEEKSWDDLEHAQLLRDALRDSEGSRAWIGPEEAVALTGLPTQRAERALDSLAGLATADVRVADGDVEYRFEDLGALPRWFGVPAWAQSLRLGLMRLWARLSDPFTGVFAAIVAATLNTGLLFASYRVSAEVGEVIHSVYSVVALPLALAGVVSFILGGLLLGLLLYPFKILLHNWLWGGFIAPLLGHPPPYRAPEGLGEYVAMPVGAAVIFGVSAMIAWWSRKIWRRALEAVAPFITPFWTAGAVRRGNLWDERQFVGLIEETDGCIDLGDVMCLYGWTRDHAYREMTRLTVDYGGDVRIDESGAISFDFQSLASDLDASATVPTDPIWEETQSPRDRFRNENSLIGELVVWILIAIPLSPWVGALVSGYRLSTLIAAIEPGLEYTGAAIGLTVTMLAALYLVGRRLQVRLAEARWQKSKPFVGALEEFATAGGELYLQPAEVDGQVVRQLGGRLHETDVDDEGRLRVEVPPLRDVR